MVIVSFLCHAVSSVSITIDSMGSPILARTTRSIACSVVPSTVLASFFVWMRNGSPVNNNDSRVTVISTSSNSTLTISPLSTSDGGQYQCIGTVMINGMPTNVTDEIDLNVTSEYNYRNPKLVYTLLSSSCSLHHQCHSDHHT